jgi:hypothetical protein
MYNSPRYISKYYHNYCFGTWNTCSQGDLSPFLSSHPTKSGYPYHQIWLFKLWWMLSSLTQLDTVQWTSTMITHVAMMAVQKKTRSYVERTQGDDFIPFAIEIHGCFLVLIHFWPLVHIPLSHIINDLLQSLQCLFLTIHIGCPYPVACTSHNDFSTSYCTWLGFFISSTHHS